MRDHEADLAARGGGGDDGASDRRTFLKDGFLAAGAVAVGFGEQKGRSVSATLSRRRHPGPPRRAGSPPNILMILVDQMRTPVWMPASLNQARLLPHVSALKARSVSFERHYTASNDCSPARSVLLTGLYTHQTGVMLTGGSWLDPRFPTWGGLLRDLGYHTAYYGKWHLDPNPMAPLDQYDFTGGTYPSPNGGPGQGTRVDPSIATQLVDWLAANAGQQPWCATASFVNPHDIAWWHRFTEEIPAEASPPRRASALPPNFETPEDLMMKGKPALQRSLQDTAARSFGAVPFTGPGAVRWFTQMMDTYLMLQRYVDTQVGRVLAALASQPKVAANTVVLFTSDHGEYAGSHGMRGKGASAYEEAIRVPFYVHDPRGALAASPGTPRTGLTSSADVTALMLSIATGSGDWRRDARYAHLARRHDMAKMCSDPAASGRRWIVHATDEDVTEFASQPYAADAPRHVTAVRTEDAKLALYSNWAPGTITVMPQGQESEFYDYSTAQGVRELSPQGAGSAREEELRALLEEEAIPGELRAPLPTHLHLAHSQGLADYQAVERFQDEKLYQVHHGGREPEPEPL